MDARPLLSSWSIRKKLILLILVAFLPAAAIIVASGINERARQILTAKNNILLLVQSLAAQQEQITIGTRQMLSTLALLPSVKTQNVAACDALFRDLSLHHPFYAIIAAARPDGAVFAASVPSNGQDSSLLDRKCFSDALNSHDFSVGEYQVGRRSKVQSINFSYPVFDTPKKLVAMVIAGLRLDTYAQFIAGTRLPENSVVIITDHKGIRLFRLPENKAAAIGTVISTESLKQISVGQDQGFFETRGDDGVVRIYAFKRLHLWQNLPPYLFMIVGIAKKTVLHPANIHLIQNLLELGIAALMALVISWFLSDATLISPINRLVTVTHRLGRGESCTRTGLSHSGDELGQLARSFDDMALLLETKDADQKKAENALRESEEHARQRVEELEKLMDLAPIAIWVAKDPLCGHISGNRLAAKIFEAIRWDTLSPSPENGLPTQPLRFFRDGMPLSLDQLPMQQATSQAIDVKNNEVEVLFPDGKRLTLLGSATPLRDAQGVVRGCIGAFMDITERKNAEQALHQSQMRLAEDLEARIRLQKIATLFVREGNLEPVLGEIVEAAMAISEADFGNIQLLDAKSLELCIVAHRGYPQWWVEFWNSAPGSHGACGAALERAERVIVEDVTQSPIFVGTPELGIQLKAGVRAVQATPLLSWSGKLLGMFSTHYKTPGRPSDRALRLLDLLARMAADIIVQAQDQEALRKSENNLRFLSGKLLIAQEEERKRISGELHDSLGSSLAGLKMVLEKTRRQLNPAQVSPGLLDIPIAWTQQIIQETRRLMTDLRPPILDDLGVIAAVNRFLGQYQTTYPGIHLEVNVCIEEDDVNSPLKIVIFRITQEAFHNIAKHSQAEQASFSLVKRNGVIELHIADQGQGFDLDVFFAETHERQGLGLRSMKERAELAGGSLTIRSAIAAGTTLTAVWPLSVAPSGATST